MNNYWLDGIMGVVAGDALGVPYEFHTREEIRNNPATTMRGYGTYNLPSGTWSDDSSMTLAELARLPGENGLRNCARDHPLESFYEYRF